jgi:sugar phosphate isomerase/epimerase
MDIGLQLWSIKEEVKESFPDALALVKKAGYSGVEFAGYFDNSPEQLKAMLDKQGLKAMGTHTSITRLSDALDEEIRYAKVLGYTMITCPYLKCDSKEDVIRDAKILEACAAKVKAEGLTIGYHNHDQEFKKFDGEYALEILFANAPSVQWEADVFWVAYAGVDPIAYVKKQVEAGRVAAIHAKEIGKDSKDNVYVGDGAIDFKAIAALCPPAKIPYIVEQEEFTSSHEDAITKSYQGLLRQLK